MSPQPKLVKSIQWLRGIAALAVVELHASSVLGKYGVLVHEDSAHLGSAGVDIFFVISGFIMYFITRRHSRTLGDTLTFWRQRFIRVAPLYWLMTSVVVAAAIFTSGLTEYRFSLDHAVTSYLFIPWLDSRGIAQPPLRVGWSLNFEAYFYFVFGVVAMLPRRAIPFLIVTWSGASVLAGAILAPSGIIGQTLTSSLLCEFAAGVLISAAWEQGAVLPRELAWLAILLGIGALAAVGVVAPILNEAIKFGIPCTLLVAGVVALEARGALTFDFAPMLWLGEWSYAIYLTHIFAIALFGQLIHRLPFVVQLPAEWIVALSVVLAAGVGAVTTRTIERPLHRRIAGRDN